MNRFLLRVTGTQFYWRPSERLFKTELNYSTEGQENWDTPIPFSRLLRITPGNVILWYFPWQPSLEHMLLLPER